MQLACDPRALVGNRSLRLFGTAFAADAHAVAHRVEGGDRDQRRNRACDAAMGDSGREAEGDQCCGCGADGDPARLAFRDREEHHGNRRRERRPVRGREGEVRGTGEGKELEGKAPPQDDRRGSSQRQHVRQDVLAVREAIAGGGDDGERREENVDGPGRDAGEHAPTLLRAGGGRLLREDDLRLRLTAGDRHGSSTV